VSAIVSADLGCCSDACWHAAHHQRSLFGSRSLAEFTVPAWMSGNNNNCVMASNVTLHLQWRQAKWRLTKASEI